MLRELQQLRGGNLAAEDALELDVFLADVQQAPHVLSCLSQALSQWCSGNDCLDCLTDYAAYFTTPLRTNGIPLSYVVDMLAHTTKGITYRKLWCNDKVDSCKVKNDFPGLGTVSFLGWKQIWEQGKAYPAGEWSGKYWRGNELGITIFQPYFWSSIDLYPYSVGLGSTPLQHSVVRPCLVRAFGVQQDTEAFIRSHLKSFFADRARQGQLNGRKDINVWVIMILSKFALGNAFLYKEALDFADAVWTLPRIALFGQLLPRALYRSTFSEQEGNIKKYVKAFIPDVTRKYKDLLVGKDCSPSKSCFVQVAAGFFESLALAGGLSVTGAIHTGTAILFSKHESNPYPQATIPSTPSGPLQFFWEVLRVFPPVAGFPRWETRPTCPGMSRRETAQLQAGGGKSRPCPRQRGLLGSYPKQNQYIGGKRKVLMLALGMEDPAVWGSDAQKFRLREMSTYNEFGGIGFAQMAKDPTVANGNMDRNCPGQDLALLMGKIWFETFRPSEWTFDNPANVSFQGVALGPWAGDYVLTPSAGGAMPRQSASPSKPAKRSIFR